MKATGIVRRVDDLGRVVIPKEIRRTSASVRETPYRYTQKKTMEIFSIVFLIRYTLKILCRALRESPVKAP